MGRTGASNKPSGTPKQREYFHQASRGYAGVGKIALIKHQRYTEGHNRFGHGPEKQRRSAGNIAQPSALYGSKPSNAEAGPGDKYLPLRRTKLLRARELQKEGSFVQTLAKRSNRKSPTMRRVWMLATAIGAFVVATGITAQPARSDESQKSMTSAQEAIRDARDQLQRSKSEKQTEGRAPKELTGTDQGPGPSDKKITVDGMPPASPVKP